MRPIAGIPGGNSRYGIDLLEEVCIGLNLDPSHEPRNVLEEMGRWSLIQRTGIPIILPRILEDLVIFETELDIAGITPESWQ